MVSAGELDEIIGSGSVLILYRWMPDQFLAAVMAGEAVHEKGGEAGFLAVQEAGVTARLAEHVARESRRFDSVLILGTGWSGPAIDFIAMNILAPVGVVDNAYVRSPPRRPNVVYFNPSPEGDPRGTWPSVTFTLGTLLGRATSLLVAASIAALLGRRSIAVRAYQNSMVKNGLHHVEDYPVAEECALRATGITATGDPASLGQAPRSVLDASLWDPCRAMLDDALLATHSGMLEAILEEEDQESPYAELEGEERPALLYLLARNASFSLERPAARVSGARACLWDPTGRSIVQPARIAARLGLRVVARHQGMVNYACAEGRRAAGWARDWASPK